MKIVYLGPSPEVNIGGHEEPHRRGESREYPEAIGKDLLDSKKQRFVTKEDHDALTEAAASGGTIPAGAKIDFIEPAKPDEKGKEPAKTVKKGKR
jgi:hypothetical protein